jgi:hypothetical protein
MKRFDENDLAKRLGGRTPPPPPDLAARIKDGIPEHVEVPPALTAPRGTLPLIGRLPIRQRLLALAATVLVAVTAVMVARRLLLPAAAPPLEVALIASAPSLDQAAAPAPAAPAAVAPQEATAPAPVTAPLAKAAAPAPARAEAGKGLRQAAGEAATSTRMPAAASGALARHARRVAGGGRGSRGGAPGGCRRRGAAGTEGAKA